MNNTRFATAIHIMTILSKFPGEVLTSDFIASSINVNSVIVRKELGILKEAGLILSKQGKQGGAMLSKESSKIFLSEIYLAVKNSEVLGKKNFNPNPSCVVGKNINNHLQTLFEETDLLVFNFLDKITLNDFGNQFN